MLILGKNLVPIKKSLQAQGPIMLELGIMFNFIYILKKFEYGFNFLYLLIGWIVYGNKLLIFVHTY